MPSGSSKKVKTSEVVQAAVNTLEKAVADWPPAEREGVRPLREVRWMLEDIIRQRDPDLVALDMFGEVNEQEKNQLESWIQRRQAGEPLAYITGHQEFFSIDFLVNKDVLIPRPETECLIEQALPFLEGLQTPVIEVLDVGAGSGCIGISLLLNDPNVRLTSVELSTGAVQVLMKNLDKHHVEDRAQVFEMDFLDFRSEQKFDLIVANPPYIAADDPMVQKSVKDFEPHVALFSPKKGSDHFRQWLAQSKLLLHDGGRFICEMGMTQKQEWLKIAEQLGFKTLDVYQDYSGKDRGLVLELI